MTTPAMSLMRSEMSFSRRIILGGVSLVLIFLLSWFLLTVNYWLGMVFFFVGSLVFIQFYFKRYQARNLLLLLTFTLFVFVLVSSLSYGIIVNYPNVFPFIQNNLADQLSMAFLIGGLGALFGVVLPFLLIVAVAAFGILKWHNKDESISYGAAFNHLLTDVLDIFQLSVKVIDGKLVGSERDLERLETIGGPGWLTVFPGHVVALQEWGKITRIVGLGSTILKREEQIKAILPLNPKGNISTIETVMTKDRIPLTVKVLHVAQMEPAKETEERLGYKKSKDGPIVGDDYIQAYESIARLVAIKSPDVWAGLKGPIEGNIKDVFMSVKFDELFNLSESDDNGEQKISTDKRKIADIENLVKEKATGSGYGKGLVLKVVDISEIQFPEELQQIINEEAYSLIKSRIRKLEANTKAETEEIEAQIRINKADAEGKAKVTEARTEQTAAQYKSRAQLKLARAKAQAKVLQGQAEGEAQAALYREILRELRQEELLSQQEISNAALQLVTATVSVKELKSFLKATARSQYVNPRVEDDPDNSEE